MPRVRLRPGVAGIEGTAVGTVTHVGAADTDGPEFLRVAVRVNGVRDILPFAPADLTLPASRSRPTGAAAQPATAAPQPAEPTPLPRRGQPSRPAATVPPASRPQAAANHSPRARSRGTATPTLVITISSRDAEWIVQATRGRQQILKATILPTGSVRAIFAVLDDDALTRAVEAVIETSRTAAEQRAEQLRAELSAIEATLAAYRPTRRGSGRDGPAGQGSDPG
jgi:hypothetical protein